MQYLFRIEWSNDTTTFVNESELQLLLKNAYKIWANYDLWFNVMGYYRV